MTEQLSTRTINWQPGKGPGDVLLRAYSEFKEMPGLRLTLAQASRLFGAGLEQCVSALDLLVDVQFLRRIGDSYIRAADGHDPRSVLAMMRSPGAFLDARRGEVS